MKKQNAFRLVILGGFGFDNLGDDLILGSALSQFRKTMKNARIDLLSNNPSETANRHRREAVTFSPEALFRQILLRPLSRISRYHKRYLQSIPGDCFRKSLRSLWKSEMIISLGGGYLNDHSRFLTHSRLIELIFVGLMRKPLLLYSQDIGPLQRLSLRILTRLTLKFVSYATVRDKRSFRLLTNLGFPQLRMAITADESWAASRPKASVGKNREKSKNLAISLMPFQELGGAGINSERTNQEIISALAMSIGDLNFKVRLVFFLSMRSQDARMASGLRKLVGPDITLQILSDTTSQYKALSESRVLISMRTHPIIMATQLNVPTIAISNLPKVRDMMAYLGVHKYAVNAVPFKISEFQSALTDLLRNEKSVKRMLRDRAMNLKWKANMNAEIARAVISPITEGRARRRKVG